ncbi:MAG: ABC transporter ATP-binding protein [Dehalococcoidia bacterium]|nr:ABC transporter ATP-binding protein [Dehalococcoidia bacterium]
MALIELTGLGQEYEGRHVLKDINLGIDRGEVFALIGPTGAGKTTLVRLLDLLDLPASGRIYFDGVDVTSSRHHRLEARRRMAYVQQKPIVFSMNVYGNVACGLRWRHEKKEVIRHKVESALEMVGMADYESRDAKTLSGGETQRVAIARALVTDPEVLLLDEPTANLDPVSVSSIEDVLAQIISEQKITVLMATHDMPQGQRLAGRIGVLIDGRLLQVGSPNEVFCSPKSREVAEFVGVENILAGVIAEKDDDLVNISVNGHVIQAISDYAIGDKVHALVRPEDVTFRLSKDPSSARNVFEGEISRMTPIGPLVRIQVDCGFPLLGVLTTRSAQELELTIGKHVYASFKATAIHIIKRRN